MFEWMSTAQRLHTQKIPFAIATVVRYTAPISGKPGDKAIIQSNGEISGWIGGGCTRSHVLQEAINSLADGQPRLVRIRPAEMRSTDPGVIEYDMDCHSGGMLEVFIEPILPRPQLVIIGNSQVGQALARLAAILDYEVVLWDSKPKEYKGISTAQTYVVVATQGEDDERALREALQLEASYFAFISSRRKAETIFQYLQHNDIAADKLRQVKVPAGLDIKGLSPQEIAVSILAEIIYVRRSPQVVTSSPQIAAKDPICGMSVVVADAKYFCEYQGDVFYFCCARCHDKFERTPEKYVVHT